MVVVRDPTTAERSLVQAGLSRGLADRWTDALHAEGWDVERVQEGLARRDIVLVAVLSGLALVLFTPLGAILTALGGVTWRSRRCRPRERLGLPGVQVPVSEAPTWSEHWTVIVTGLLMWTTAVLLWWWPLTAVVPLVLIPLVWWMAAGSPMDEAARALAGRVEASLVTIRRRLEHGEDDLDTHLLMLGELNALEAEWHAGGLEREEVLDRIERLTTTLDPRDS
jgi:hypothetical protein